MPSWDSVVTEALTELGADQTMVPGAKLKHRVEDVGRRNGFDVDAFLRAASDGFSRLVSKVDGVKVVTRPGSDVLVGLASAQPPNIDTNPGPRTPLGPFRQDVYEAFTQLSPIGFVYLTGSDKFTPSNEAQGPSIAVPEVTLDQLIGDRKAFIESLPPGPVQDSLRDALQRSARPLADFRVALGNAGLIGAWSSRQASIIRERVVAWCQTNNVSLRDTWLMRESARPTAQNALERLIPYLTAEEIRGLSIPFRAVEALISDLTRE